MKLANKSGVSGWETRRLLHVDIFSKMSIQESIVYVKLMYRPACRQCHSENNSYSSWLDNRVECVSEITLMKPLGTILALCRCRVPSSLNLHLKTHLQPIRFTPGGKGVSVQVLLSSRAAYSAFMACNQGGCCMACLYVVGSKSYWVVEV